MMPHEPLPHSLYLSQADIQRMRFDVTQRAPEEACGLLSGQIKAGTYRAVAVIPTTNELHSPFRYRIDPHEQITAFNQIDSQGLELVGIYHSHPAGPSEPSPTDIAEAYYPEVVYLIWSAQTGDWQCKAFLIQKGQVIPVEISIINLE
jgi:[CysO sulfur-carrier protein]-S-L-cysteine hydrolase